MIAITYNAPWAHGQAICWSDKIVSDSFQDRPLCICRVMLPVCGFIAVYQASICIGTSHSPMYWHIAFAITVRRTEIAGQHIMIHYR